jgi:hypothetical protein
MGEGKEVFHGEFWAGRTAPTRLPGSPTQIVQRLRSRIDSPAILQSFFRSVGPIFRPPSAGVSYGERHARVREAGTGLPERCLMYDLAAIGIAAACFAFLFVILWVFDRV